MKKITLLFFFLSTSLIFAQTTIGESTLFSTTTNATYTHFYAANTLGDGNTGEQVEFKINITTLPVGGESYRIGKTLASGTWYFSNAKTLTEGLNTITVAAVSFNRAVKIQFTSSALAFDSIILNDETIFDDTASAPARDGATDTISNSPVFDTTTNATWGFVTTLCTAAEGASTQSAQTFKIYITDLPTDGANYRVVKTVANGNWNNGNAQALSEGLNTITVSGVSFDRSVKLQFSSGAIEFDELSLNNLSNDKAVNSSELFDDVVNETWKHSLLAVTAARDGASSQSAQTLVIDITKLPGVASYRVVKTIANGNFYNGNAQALSLGLNTITVAGVAFDRTVKFQFTTGEDIEYNSITLNGSVFWDGSTDTSWDTSLNWSTNTAPTSTSDILIRDGLSNYPVVSETTGVAINNLTVDANASLSINNGGSLIVNGTSAGNITYNRTLETDNWYLIASPVIGQGIDNFGSNAGLASGTNTNLGLASYDNTQIAWDYYQNGASDSGNFASGSGRSLKLATAGDISYTGTMPVDNVGIEITSNSNGYNLVGNPYPSYIASSDLLTNNTSSLSEMSLYFWNQATDSYDVINQASSMYISPGQGFFVNTSGTNTFNFTEAMQSHQSDSFQRISNERPEISLVLNDGKNTRNTQIYYIAGTTTGFDNGYDSSVFGGFSDNFSVFSQLVANGSRKNLAIQSLPKGDYQNMIVPVGVIAESGSNLEFSAKSENLPEGINVFLEDREESTFTRLDELNAAYKITTASAMNGVGRFYLHTTQSVLNTTDAKLDNVSVFKVHNSLRIVGLQQGKAAVKLFNVLGKQVLNTAFESNGTKDVSLPSLAKGVYIVQLETVEGKLNKKIILE